MKLRYRRLATHPLAIKLFRLFWFRHFQDGEIIRLTSWRAARMRVPGNAYTHVTACPRWAPWLI